MKEILEMLNSERKKVLHDFYHKTLEQLMQKIRDSPTAVDFTIDIDFPSLEIAQIVSQYLNSEGIITSVQTSWFKQWYYPMTTYYLQCTIRCQEDLLSTISTIPKNYTYDDSSEDEK